MKTFMTLSYLYLWLGNLHPDTGASHGIHYFKKLKGFSLFGDFILQGCLATKKMRKKREKKRMNKSALINYKVTGYKMIVSEALHLYLKTIKN